MSMTPWLDPSNQAGTRDATFHVVQISSSKTEAIAAGLGSRSPPGVFHDSDELSSRSFQVTSCSAQDERIACASIATGSSRTDVDHSERDALSITAPDGTEERSNERSSRCSFCGSVLIRSSFVVALVIVCLVLFQIGIHRWTQLDTGCRGRRDGSALAYPSASA